jgi:2-oxoisovalerate dehydrogenase E1 component
VAEKEKLATAVEPPAITAKPEAPPESEPQPPLWEELQKAQEEAVTQAKFEDDLMPKAIAMVRDMQKASTSLLQRRFRIGYTRAARMIDAMEGMGIIGPPTGTSKAREVLLPKEESRLKVTEGKNRFAFENGKPLPKLKTLTYAEALFEAMIYRFYEDPTMVAYGEENRDWGGAFSVYRGLTECLPYHRLFNSPISEASIVGTAVGYALCGGRVVAELMYCDFMGRAGDEIFNQMSKWQAMSANELQMPLVLRVSVGSKYGAQHSQDWASIVAHIPGLKVMFPATPYDAKGMLNLALHGTDPVVFFESQRLYPEPETLVESGVPVEYYEVEMGEPAVRRTGSDITMVTIGATLYRALEAAAELEEKYGLTSEVIDARFINPLNYDKIVESVKKTGKVLLASDACERGSYAHNIASNISQLAFDYLDGPVAVVGSRNWITPAAEMEHGFFPQKEWIVDTIHERVLPLPGHEVSTVQATDEILRRNQLGI